MDTEDQEFKEFISRLEPGSSPEKGYRQLRLKLMKFFGWRRCEDPESLADETISRLVKNLKAKQEIHGAKAYSYVYGIAINVFREYLREQKKRAAIAENLTEPQDPVYRPELEDCRQRCFDSLNSSDRALLREYYQGEKNRVALAKSEGLTLNALRLRVYRTKQGLKTCCEECMKDLEK